VVFPFSFVLVSSVSSGVGCAIILDYLNSSYYCYHYCYSYVLANNNNCSLSFPFVSVLVSSVSSGGGGCAIMGLFLLHGLMFGKPQSHSLGHFDVTGRTVFDTGSFRLVQRFRAEGTHTSPKTSLHQTVVHADMNGRNKQTQPQETRKE
jgi:hypothetical protein